MARYRTLGEYRFSRTSCEDDVRGSKIYGLGDEYIGLIDDVIFDQDSGRLHAVIVVPVGGDEGRFIIPIEAIHPSFLHRNDCRIEVTREQVKQFPSYVGAETLKAMSRAENGSEVWKGPVTKIEVHVRDQVEIEEIDADAAVIGVGSRWLNFERQLRLLRTDGTAIPIRKRTGRHGSAGDVRSKVS
ncbi:MAG TPA: PRC-barrel domain-containing protein [Terriglobales bacterium]|jgi:sporulation protein YlmC with PRC-barrel domain|nr:PRC-barrel domain-containing protein [Terriglobales bacterium]